MNFTGWKYFEIPLRETNDGREMNYQWRGNSPYSLYPADPNNLVNVGFWYNNIPVGQTVSCYISAVKALPVATTTLTNPSVTVGGQTLTFPVSMTSGQYIEANSMTDCTLYDQNGFYLQLITPTGTFPTLAEGANTVTFNCTPPSGYNARCGSRSAITTWNRRITTPRRWARGVSMRPAARWQLMLRLT